MMSGSLYSTVVCTVPAGQNCGIYATNMSLKEIVFFCGNFMMKEVQIYTHNSQQL
jgi:hypothetical protein